MELEFLKPHIPTVEEKADPVLFASNVRKEMAAALGIQLCDLRWPGFSLVKFSIYFPQFRGHQEQVYQEEQGRLGTDPKHLVRPCHQEQSRKRPEHGL